MKLLPKNKNKREYPTIEEYIETKNKSKTSLIMATTISLTLSLTPFFLTSCNTKKTTSEKSTSQIKKDNSKKISEKNNSEKDNSKKDDNNSEKDDLEKIPQPRPQILGRIGHHEEIDILKPILKKKDNSKKNDKSKNIVKPQALDGVVGSFNDNPCDTDKKPKKNDKKNNKKDKVIKPEIRKRGVRVRPRFNEVELNKDKKVNKIDKKNDKKDTEKVKRPEVIKKPRVLKGKRVAPKKDDK